MYPYSPPTFPSLQFVGFLNRKWNMYLNHKRQRVFLGLTVWEKSSSTPKRPSDEYWWIAIVGNITGAELFIYLILFWILKQVFSKIEIWLIWCNNCIIIGEVVKGNMSKRHCHFPKFWFIKCAINPFFEVDIQMKVLDDDFSLASILLDYVIVLKIV